VRHRYGAARTLEAGALEIEAERPQLRTALKGDPDERARQTDEAAVLFSEFAQRLYETGRPAHLEFDAGPSSLKIVPHVDGDDSRGTGNMVISWFDLTTAAPTSWYATAISSTAPTPAGYAEPWSRPPG